MKKVFENIKLALLLYFVLFFYPLYYIYKYNKGNRNN